LDWKPNYRSSPSRFASSSFLVVEVEGNIAVVLSCSLQVIFYAFCK